MTFDRRRGELRGSLSPPPAFTQQSTMINLLNLTPTTRLDLTTPFANHAARLAPVCEKLCERVSTPIWIGVLQYW